MPTLAGSRPAAQSIAGLHAGPLPNAHEQRYILDTVLYENKLKIDHFYRADRDEERLVWMVRTAEGLADSRIGFDAYKRLHESVTDALLQMAQCLEKPAECFEATKHCSHLVPRIYCQIVLMARLPSGDTSVLLGGLRDELAGVLNPVKGVFVRAFAHQTVPQLFDAPSLALDNTVRLVSLLTRWTRYGGCGDVEVREWERDSMYHLVEDALQHLLSLCRGDPEHLFAEFVVQKLVSEFVCSLLDDATQHRLFVSILDSVPRAITARFLEKMLLAVVRFSPAVNITLLLQRLCEDALGEGSVAVQVVWERIKEIIAMRPELDLNDALRLCNAMTGFSLREGKSDSVADMLAFIEHNLLDDIHLSSTEPAAYVLLAILELVVSSVKSEADVNQLLPAIVSIGERKVDRSCLTGLGRRALHATRCVELSDWTAMSALLHLADPPTDDIVADIVSRSDFPQALPFFKPYPDFVQAILSSALHRHRHTSMQDVAAWKDVLQPPRPEHFQLHIDLLSKCESGRDRYDLLVNVPPTLGCCC